MPTWGGGCYTLHCNPVLSSVPQTVGALAGQDALRGLWGAPPCTALTVLCLGVCCCSLVCLVSTSLLPDAMRTHRIPLGISHPVFKVG